MEPNTQEQNKNNIDNKKSNQNSDENLEDVVDDYVESQKNILNSDDSSFDYLESKKNQKRLEKYKGLSDKEKNALVSSEISESLNIKYSPFKKKLFSSLAKYSSIDMFKKDYEKIISKYTQKKENFSKDISSLEETLFGGAIYEPPFEDETCDAFMSRIKHIPDSKKSLSFQRDYLLEEKNYILEDVNKLKATVKNFKSLKLEVDLKLKDDSYSSSQKRIFKKESNSYDRELRSFDHASRELAKDLRANDREFKKINAIFNEKYTFLNENYNLLFICDEIIATFDYKFSSLSESNSLTHISRKANDLAELTSKLSEAENIVDNTIVDSMKDSKRIISNVSYDRSSTLSDYLSSSSSSNSFSKGYDYLNKTMDDLGLND